MKKYRLEDILQLVKRKTRTKGFIGYNIFNQDNFYLFKIFEGFQVNDITIRVPICTFLINKENLVIESVQHSFILITKWNKRIVSTIGGLTCSQIEDLMDYVSEEIVHEKRTEQNNRHHSQGDGVCQESESSNGDGDA